MQLNKVKMTVIPRPFIKNDDVAIVTNHVKNKIIGWTVTYKGAMKEFKVKDMEILQTWQQVEKHLAELK